jgi:hypothetical protein
MNLLIIITSKKLFVMSISRAVLTVLANVLANYAKPGVCSLGGLKRIFLPQSSATKVA